MADNVEASAGSGGATFATDDVAGVHYPRSKVVWGADGVATDVSAADPLPVTAAALPLPSGASTAALQTTGNTSLATLAGAVAGTEIQVDVVTMPSTAVTNAGLTALNGAIAGTEVQVDVLTMPTVTVNAHAVTNAGTFVVQENGAALTALQLLDDAAVVLGTATYTEAASTGLAIGAVRRDADTTLVGLTNEWGPLQMDANGRLKVEAFSGETLPVSLTSTTVTGTVAVTQSGTWDEVGINDSGNSITVDAPVATPVFVRLSDGAAAITTLAVSLASLPTLAAGINNIGDVDVASIAAGDNNIGNVDIVTMPNVTLAAGTNTNEVVGDVADGVAAAGNPLGIGLIARTTNRTAVSDGQAVRAAADDMGRALVVIGQPRDLIGQQHTQIASSAAETTIVTAVASTFCDLVQLVITNQTATAVNVTIKDSTAGTTRMIIALAASGGAVIPFPRPIPQATVNNNWTATLSSAAVTVNIFALFERNV